MSGLRASSGLTNLVADTLRLRDLSGGLLTLSAKGVVRNDSSPALQNLTVSGQTQLHDTTVFGNLTTNSLNVLTSATIGHLDATSASLNSMTVSSATVSQLDVSSAVIDYLPQFDPYGNDFSLLSSDAPLPQLIDGYNQLITLFANRQIFLSLIAPLITFQTPCDIHISEYFNNSIIGTFSYFQSSQANISIVSIVETLNNLGAQLQFNVSNSVVSFQEPSGYSFTFTDHEVYGSSHLFLNHLGLTSLQASYPSSPGYHGATTFYSNGVGSLVGNLTGTTPPIPSPPATPTLVGSATQHGFIINLPASPPASIKQVAIYVEASGSPLGVQSWDISSSSITSYTFTTLTPSTIYFVSLSYLTDYDESTLSSPLTVTTLAPPAPRIFNMAGAAGYITTPANFNGVPLTSLTVLTTNTNFWTNPALTNLTRLSQITHIVLTIGYVVIGPYSLTAYLGAVGDTPFFTDPTSPPHQGGVFQKSYFLDDFKTWFPTTTPGGDIIDKTIPFSFAWTFTNTVRFTGQGTFDTFDIYWEYNA